MLLSFLMAMGAAVRARTTRGLTYAAAAGAKLDLYAPVGADGEAPVVVFAHFTRMSGGRRHLFRFVGQTLALRGFVTAIPYLFGSVAMVLWARHSDQTRERVWHVGLPLLLTALALGACGYIQDPTLTMVAITIAAIGVFCTFALFWTLPTAWLSGTAAAGGIALINSIGNLAGFGGPYLIGWIKEATGSTSTGLLVLAILPLIAGLLVLFGKHGTTTEFATPVAPLRVK